MNNTQAQPTKHRPTKPAHREAYLSFLAQELERTAATWGYTAAIVMTKLREAPRG